MPAKILAVEPVLMVSDVSKSIEFYSLLGFKLAFQDSETDPKYAGIRRDNIFLFLQWHAVGEWDPQADRPTYRFVVEDIEELHNQFSHTGKITNLKPVENTPWGTREFHVQDLDRNGLQFYHDL